MLIFYKFGSYNNFFKNFIKYFNRIVCVFFIFNFFNILYKYYFNKKFTFLIYATLFLFIGILIRPQLIFFGPTIIFFSLYLVSLTKRKKFFLIIPFVSILFFVPQQINKYFNNFYNQVNVPMTDSYNQLMILPLFISKIELKDFFEDQKIG